MIFHFAPVQGHTDAPYRHFHNSIYSTPGSEASSGPIYYTPFIRLEGGELRKKDLKDFTSHLNADATNIPQIIFRDQKELSSLVDLMRQNGATRLDLNMGCPFPLQTGHGRGAATVSNKDLALSVAEIIRNNQDIEFSVKMRLGLNDPDEWKSLIPILNGVKLSHLAIHPRIARQQYSGSLYLDRFEEILNESANPVVYNGDLRTPEDVSAILQKFPNVAGIMVGRGLLGRPSLIHEVQSGTSWTREHRLEKMLQFHKTLLDYYSNQLCGEAQIISKIQPFWEYAEEEIGRKAWKAIRKAGNMAKYNSGVAMIQI